MDSKSNLFWAGRYLALAVILFCLYGMDFAGLQLNPMVRQAPLWLAVMALLDTAVLAYPIRQARWRGWRLAAAVLPAFYGLKTLLVGIETAYLTELMPLDLVVSLLINGLITAVIFVPLAVWGYGRFAPVETSAQPVLRFRPWWSTLWRVPLAGLAYTILFVAAGLLVFRPLAFAFDATTAAAYLAGFASPPWILLFIFARGMLWALMTLPLVLAGNGRSWPHALGTGLLFGVLMASNLLLPSDIPPTIRPAHLAELFVENLLFGLFVVWLLAPAVVRPQAEADAARRTAVAR